MITRMNAFLRKLISPTSLRYQLLTRILFILSFILLVIGILQYFVMKDFLYQNEAEKMEASLVNLSRTVVIRPEFQMERGINLQNEFPKFVFMENFSLALIGANGEFIDLLANNGLSAPIPSEDEYAQLVTESFRKGEIDYKVLTDSDKGEQLVIYRPIGKIIGTSISAPQAFFQLGTSVKPLQDTLMRQLSTFMILAALALAAGVAVYFSAIRKTLTPLGNIVDAVGHINAGNLSERIPGQQGQEEIDRLADSFNEMLERLETSFLYERETKERMRRFIADASHELRTPLTSIHGFLEVLLRGAAYRPEQLQQALTSMHGESKRIIKLVEDLLLLAKIDKAPELELSEVNLTELIREMEPQLQMLANTRNVLFDLQDDVCGKFDADKFKQVLLNLFQNAVQHTDEASGIITIVLETSERDALLSIHDNGTGIKADVLPHVFDRFYRVDSSRTRQSGGAGLGLAITKSIIEAHGGNVAVESTVGEGATFTITLPL